METNKFKRGLVIGKFMPFHKGHEYLINSAARMCDKVSVIVESRSDQPIDGDQRYGWLLNTYEDTNVEVFHSSDDNIPETPEGDPEFWDKWIPMVQSFVPDSDVVFTSEDYGAEIAERLGIWNIRVDKERNHFNTSGTACREDIYKNWVSLTKAVQETYEKRILIVGPESTGKSTMCQKINEKFGIEVVPEFGRTYCDSVKTDDLTGDDFIKIAIGHSNLEDYARNNHGITVSDTDAMTTLIFYDLYCKRNGFKRDAETMISIMDKRKHYDLILLLNTDVDWIQDGQRDFGDIRDEVMELFGVYKSICAVEITGKDFTDRETQVFTEIEKFLHSDT